MSSARRRRSRRATRAFGRQAQRQLLVGVGRRHLAPQPARAGAVAALLQLFRKARQARQRLFDARRDVVARAAPAHHQALLDQLVDRLACGDARDVQLFRQRALGGQRLVGLVAAVAHVCASLRASCMYSGEPDARSGLNDTGRALIAAPRRGPTRRAARPARHRRCRLAAAPGARAARPANVRAAARRCPR